MSTFIPILSSSPPPMDDGSFGGDDWEEDEFGGFQTANSETSGSLQDAVSQVPYERKAKSNLENNPVINSMDSGSFPNSLQETESFPCDKPFQKVSDDPKRIPSPDCSFDSHIDNDCDDGMNFKPSQTPKSEAQDNTSQESVVTDSGLCSDVSPGPKCEDEAELTSPDNQVGEIDVTLTASEDSGNDGLEADDMYNSDASASYLKDVSEGDVEPLDLKVPGYDEICEDFDDDSFEQFNSAREVSTNLQLDSPDTECSEESKTESATQEVLDVTPTEDADGENNDAVLANASGGEDFDDCQSGAEEDILSPSSSSHIDVPESDRHLQNSVNISNKELPESEVSAEKCDTFQAQEASISSSDMAGDDFGEFSASDGEFGNFLTSKVKSGDKGSTVEKELHEFAFPTENNSENKLERKGIDDEDTDDDWAFHDAKPASATGDEWAFQSTNEEVSTEAGFAQFGDEGNDFSESNWASFQDSAPPPPVSAVEEDDFGDFEDVRTEDPVTTSVNSFLKGDIPFMDDVLKRCFLQQDINGNPVNEVDQLLGHLCKENIRTEEKQEIVPGNRHPTTTCITVDLNIWNHLKDIENTKALEYNWRDSSNKTCLLKSLAIDARNILMNVKRQGSTTMFPSGATSPTNILEPLQPVPAMPSASSLLNSNNKKNTSSDDQNLQSTDSLPQANTPQQDIPAAEFDWISSGLTNPLDSANLRLDLDFFITHPSSSSNITSPTAALENELLKSIEPSRKDQPKSLQPLEELLANMKYSSTATMASKKEQQLSPDALRILQTFPDISFMKAKYLVFPLRSMAENHQDET